MKIKVITMTVKAILVVIITTATDSNKVNMLANPLVDPHVAPFFSLNATKCILFLIDK